MNFQTGGDIIYPLSRRRRRSSGGGPSGPHDPLISNVVLLMGFEGTDGSTGVPGFSDESPAHHGVAAVVNASISASFFKLGASSAFFPATHNAVLTFPNSADWQLGSGPFTIEMWVCGDTSIGSFGPILIGLWGASGNFSWQLGVNGQKLVWWASTDGTITHNDITGFASLPFFTTTPSTWTAVAIDYDGTKYRVYHDGTVDGSFSTPRTLFNSSAVLSIGANYNNTLDNYGGYIDELRITKGVARYANDAGYTVQSAQFPRN